MILKFEREINQFGGKCGVILRCRTPTRIASFAHPVARTFRSQEPLEFTKD
jgi:hypothetical protein